MQNVGRGTRANSRQKLDDTKAARYILTLLSLVLDMYSSSSERHISNSRITLSKFWASATE